AQCACRAPPEERRQGTAPIQVEPALPASGRRARRRRREAAGEGDAWQPCWRGVSQCRRANARLRAYLVGGAIPCLANASAILTASAFVLANDVLVATATTRPRRGTVMSEVEPPMKTSPSGPASAVDSPASGSCSRSQPRP